MEVGKQAQRRWAVDRHHEDHRRDRGRREPAARPSCSSSGHRFARVGADHHTGDHVVRVAHTDDTLPRQAPRPESSAWWRRPAAALARRGDPFEGARDVWPERPNDTSRSTCNSPPHPTIW